MKGQRPGTHLETYREEWQYFFKIHAPLTLVIAALLVIGTNAIMGYELSWPMLGIIWCVIVILPLAWKLPPAPTIESDR